MSIHPYIPNSVPEVRDDMLRQIGAPDIGSLYREIPDNLKTTRPLDIPEAYLSEYDLKRHLETILAKNGTCDEYANFLGAGCYQHFVPAVCDEVNSRGEFLTAYAGATYSDHGKHQAWFEFQSMLGELLEMDVVGFPTYDWSTAACSAVLMACRLTNRDQILVPRNLSPERAQHMRSYVNRAASIVPVEFDRDTGVLDLEDLARKLSARSAAVYFENPTYLGVLEPCGAVISDLAHKHGALVVAGVNPITLGVLVPPSMYGADLVCGDAQPLGVHMQVGGGLCGFIASHDDVRVMSEFPTLFETICRTERSGEWGFGWATLERTSYDKRHESRDFTGTSTGLWAITAGVYLALMGPQGIRDVGESILLRARYAMTRLASIKRLDVPVLKAPGFMEFVVGFPRTGKSVEEVNRELLQHGVFGGLDLSASFPELGQSALYCVTEVTSKEKIDRLVASLEEILE